MLRLLPLYYAVLLLQAVLVFGLHQYTPENRELFREKLPAYLFYYSNWLPTMTQGPFFCSWSLAVEEQFYIVFALVFFFCRRSVTIWLVAAALVLKVLVYQVFGTVDAHSELCLVLFSYREPILLGVLAAFVLNSEIGYARVKKWLASGWLTAACGLLLVASLLLHAMRQESAWDSQVLYVLMTLFLAGIVVRPRVPILRANFLTHVGKISYGIYLLHMVVRSSLKKFAWGDDFFFAFFGTVVLTILLATVVYNYFEQPIIRFYKARFAPSAAPAPIPRPAEVFQGDGAISA